MVLPLQGSLLRARLQPAGARQLKRPPPPPPTHLDDGVLPVHLALVVLAQHLDLPAQLLHLGKAHDLAPLVVDLDAVDARVLLLAHLALAQHYARRLLRGGGPGGEGAAGRVLAGRGDGSASQLHCGVQ
jgi:hypothetical protein